MSDSVTRAEPGVEAAVRERPAREKNVRLCTVRPDGSPAWDPRVVRVGSPSWPRGMP
ncbi:hypothetical protein [Streptomyces capitiformicae]|uniref:Uncharacterized protein n=1 Tax=Streptomyces capitiformicae TaxID=2014920 RepID=A0A919GF13_9ACTN|nr:hypothetical protein [Streptomyces capitiformicae]GHH82998.1 hypothetical protein GCM10017771_08710 [Streptomyces capitiformicae]